MTTVDTGVAGERDLDKLPVWARAYIANLTNQLAEARREADRERAYATNHAHSDTFVHPYHDRGPFGLGRRALVEYRLGEERYVHVRLHEHGYVEVRGAGRMSDMLAVYPQSSNVVRVQVVEA